MLPGLKEGQEKMPKSDPSSAIFMEDDEVYISHEIFFFLTNILLLILVLVTPNDCARVVQLYFAWVSGDGSMVKDTAWLECCTVVVYVSHLLARK